MRVLSLFDGISCARVALERAGLPVTEYLASEVDPHAITISAKNYPDIVRLGDVREVWMSDLKGPIDLMIGGSPCQDLSIGKQGRRGLEGDRSSLFWEYVRIWELLRPRWWILENVASMPKADRDTITQTLGVEPVLIDAALVSAQSRKRLFWTNIPVTQPDDRGLVLTGMRIGRDIGRRLNANGRRADGDPSLPYVRRVELREDGKCGTLTSVLKDNLVVTDDGGRSLTPLECERLQGLPDGYTEGVAKTHRYKALGNAFHVEVIAHICRSLRGEASGGSPGWGGKDSCGENG